MTGLTSSLRIVQSDQVTTDLTPFTVYLNIDYTYNSTLATIVKYAFDVKRFTISGYFAFKYSPHVEISISTTTLSATTCTHGQYILTDSEVEVCMRNVDSPVLLVFSPVSTYPNVIPTFNDFSEQIDR